MIVKTDFEKLENDFCFEKSEIVNKKVNPEDIDLESIRICIDSLRDENKDSAHTYNFQEFKLIYSGNAKYYFYTLSIKNIIILTHVTTKDVEPKIVRSVCHRNHDYMLPHIKYLEKYLHDALENAEFGIAKEEEDILIDYIENNTC